MDAALTNGLVPAFDHAFDLVVRPIRGLRFLLRAKRLSGESGPSARHVCIGSAKPLTVCLPRSVNLNAPSASL